MVTELSESYPVFEPLRVFLDATNQPMDLADLSERDYIVRALDFANATDPVKLHALRVELIGGVSVPDHVYFHELHAPLNSHMLALRAEFEARLEVIRADTRKARVDLAGTVRSAGAQIAIRPRHALTRDGVTVSYRYYPADLESALGYVLLLMLDPSRPYGTNLCRCRLAECRRFFLAIKPKTGRTRREYCTQGHLEKSRALDGAERVRRHRLKKQSTRAKSRRLVRP